MVMYPYYEYIYQTYFAADFDPTTGAGTGTTGNSPVKDQSANIMYWKTSSFSISYTSVLSNNTNANVFMCYSDEASL